MNTFLLIAAIYALPAPVAITVRPSFATTPGAFQVRAIIEKHGDNRLLVIEAVQYGLFHVRRTPFVIAGAQSQRVFTPTNPCICWFDLPVGSYEAVATLTRYEDGQEKRYVDRRPFHVVGMEP